MRIAGVYNSDCIEGMKSFPDKHFDLAIVDPPYGLGNKLIKGGGNRGRFRTDIRIREWDIVPGPDYFKELFRVSKNQIIFGGNYFPLPPCRCFVIWDKWQVLPNFSQAEFAWTSFDKPAKLFKQKQAGFVGEKKIHSCQKPIELYRYLLCEFAVPGDKILDTHLGSGSSRIAAHQMGFDFTGYEIDQKYFNDSDKRFRLHTSQQALQFKAS